MRIAIATMAALLAACGPANLSEDRARELVLAQEGFASPVMCAVALYQTLAGDAPYVRQIICAEHLATAHMVDRAGTDDEVTSNGRARVYLSTPPTTQGDNMMLPCATLRLISVSGIATSGNTADFRYERELVLNPGVEAAGTACGFPVPRAGIETRDRHARRDDQGEWSLVPEPR